MDETTRTGRKPWTEKHRSEALLLMLDAQREQVCEGVKHLGEVLYEDTETEEELRDAIDAVFGFPPARIERAMRRLRALAEGWPVMSTTGERPRPADVALACKLNERRDDRHCWAFAPGKTDPCMLPDGHEGAHAHVEASRIRVTSDGRVITAEVAT